jgi:hypothetical protein
MTARKGQRRGAHQAQPVRFPFGMAFLDSLPGGGVGVYAARLRPNVKKAGIMGFFAHLPSGVCLARSVRLVSRFCGVCGRPWYKGSYLRKAVASFMKILVAGA